MNGLRFVFMIFKLIPFVQSMFVQGPIPNQGCGSPQYENNPGHDRGCYSLTQITEQAEQAKKEKETVFNIQYAFLS
ncbi:hypothetical protein VN97_g1916 [Penicillium thymicola]|uniref:Uncharacterized protein n=1 Tax=Penicillium thymicola TaxID=293382 RepID=A0AAI9TQ44_PENTH|nr:hypothetical protein VN97_g1916 [Penicillium thymicola]